MIHNNLDGHLPAQCALSFFAQFLARLCGGGGGFLVILCCSWAFWGAFVVIILLFFVGLRFVGGNWL